MLHLLAAIHTARQGNDARALPLFQAALTENPDSAEAHAHLAMCLLRMGRPFAASEEADRALAANPELALAHVAKAAICTLLDDPSRAEDALREALRIEPENTDALAIRCVKELRDRRAGPLGDAALTLVRKEPGSAAGHAFLSRAATLAGDGPAAERHAREALRIAPEDPDAHVAIGWAFWAQRALKRAREAGLSALAIAPDSSPAQALLVAADMHAHPLTGWVHRLGFAVNSLTMRRALFVGPPAIFAYLILPDLLEHAGLDRAARGLDYLLFAFLVLITLSAHMYGKRVAGHRKSARLRHSY